MMRYNRFVGLLGTNMIALCALTGDSPSVLPAQFLVTFESIITIQLVPSFETSNMAR